MRFMRLVQGSGSRFWFKVLVQRRPPTADRRPPNPGPDRVRAATPIVYSRMRRFILFASVLVFTATVFTLRVPAQQALPQPAATPAAGPWAEMKWRSIGPHRASRTRA